MEEVNKSKRNERGGFCAQSGQEHHQGRDVVNRDTRRILHESLPFCACLESQCVSRRRCILRCRVFEAQINRLLRHSQKSVP